MSAFKEVFSFFSGLFQDPAFTIGGILATLACILLILWLNSRGEKSAADGGELLEKLVGFTKLDLESNRRGRVTPSQRKRLGKSTTVIISTIVVLCALSAGIIVAVAVWLLPAIFSDTMSAVVLVLVFVGLLAIGGLIAFIWVIVMFFRILFFLRDELKAPRIIMARTHLDFEEQEIDHFIFKHLRTHRYFIKYDSPSPHKSIRFTLGTVKRNGALLGRLKGMPCILYFTPVAGLGMGMKSLESGMLLSVDLRAGDAAGGESAE
jgi:hypothetical protein